MRSVNTSVNTLALAAAIALSLTSHAQPKSASGAKASTPAKASSLAGTATATATATSSAANAAAPGAPAPSPAKDEKVDISDLENKYWAPKDTDFSVVQNRTYTKDHRFFFSTQFGFSTSDKYSTGSLYNFTGNYFLSERHGLQASYMRADMHPNNSVTDFANISTGVYPDHGRITSYYGLGYNFVPFYAKMSFMGSKIIYFDMAVTPTLGMTNYIQLKQSGNANKSALTYGLDVTQFFFFSNWVALRVDWKNQFYSQKIVKYRDTNVGGTFKEGDPVASKMIHDSLFLLGVTFFY
jgi:outer membrane beta-barrel protein